MAPTAILNELLDRIAPTHRKAFRHDYEAIRQLPGAPTDLQEFLDDFLDHCHRLYAATAGAIWLVGGLAGWVEPTKASSLFMKAPW